ERIALNPPLRRKATNPKPCRTALARLGLHTASRQAQTVHPVDARRNAKAHQSSLFPLSPLSPSHRYCFFPSLSALSRFLPSDSLSQHSHRRAAGREPPQQVPKCGNERKESYGIGHRGDFELMYQVAAWCGLVRVCHKSQPGGKAQACLS
ncbi:hypothetical protein BGY98DRAFT_984235, partial [Russula aff. rugulosa BPL654]